MNARLSAAKHTALVALVQANPNIGSDDSTAIGNLVDRAAMWFVQRARLPRYPELAQGYVLSAKSASKDISGLSTNTFEISVNGGLHDIISLTLVGLTTGAAIATELQAKIRASSADRFNEVTVVFDGTDGVPDTYLITSGRYGESSKIVIGFDENDNNVCQALKIATIYGAISVVGAFENTSVDGAVVGLVEHLYAMTGVEGATGVNISGGDSISGMGIPKWVLQTLSDTRRLWST